MKFKSFNLVTFFFVLRMWVGRGVDENVIVLILGHRNAFQRKEIKETYQQLYKESIIYRLHSKISGVLKVLCVHTLASFLCLTYNSKLYGYKLIVLITYLINSLNGASRSENMVDL